MAWGGLLAGAAHGASQAELRPKTAPPAAELARLLERAETLALAEHPQWLALLHYEREWLPRRRRSHVSTPEFFLSETGAHDADAELRATLSAFFEVPVSGSEDTHPQCRFIARRQWLRGQLAIPSEGLPEVACSEFEAWSAGLGARGISLIFPEEFMNNAASAFGHTLLRIDVSTEVGPDEILGQAVDFTARTGDAGGVAYMAGGLTGRYPASAGIHPYHLQLKRYSDWENRDIWEYRLAVGGDPLDLVVRHLWELRDVDFPYYFFTKNCSYELLRLLEVGIPELEASGDFRGPVIPVDTVRALAMTPGLVTATRFRPSPESQLRSDLRSLDREQRRWVAKIAAGEIDPAGPELSELSEAQRARVLDVAYDQLRYEFLAGHVSDVESRGLSRRILVARSALPRPVPGEGNEAGVPEPRTRPDQGHESSLVAVGGGWRDDESYIDLRVRPAFHALMDNSGGMPEAMELRLLDTRLRIYPESGRARLEELTLVELTSLAPRSRVFRPWAWSGKMGVRNRRLPHRGDLDDATVFGTDVAVGLAWDPHPAILLYGLADARLDLGSRLEHDVSFGPGARVGGYAGGADDAWRIHLFGDFARFALGDVTTWLRGGAAARFTVTRNTAVTLESEVVHSYGETWFQGGLQVGLYF